MRTRKTPDMRRTEILDVALGLFLDRGYSEVQIEHIRKESGLSRGGFYHHFASKPAVLQALVEREQAALAEAAGPDLVALLTRGSAYLQAEPGVEASLTQAEDITLYLGFLEEAQDRHLAPLVETALTLTGPLPMPADHATQILLAVNHRINRQVMAGAWTDRQAIAFTRSALLACETMLDREGFFSSVLAALEGGA